MPEFTVPPGTPRAVKSHHPFLPAMRDIRRPTPAAGLIVISAFFAPVLFSYIFFAAHRRVPLAHVVFCPLFSRHPVIMWARRTKQGKKPARLGKKSLCIFKSLVGQTGKGSDEAQRASRRERGGQVARVRVKRRERMREGRRKGVRCDCQATPATTMERDGGQRGRVRHYNGPCLHTRKLADTEKNGDCLGMRQKLFGKKKEQPTSQREYD